MPIPSEALEKEHRIQKALAGLGYDSVVITRRDNFAWLTCGGRAVVAYFEPISPVFLVLTPSARYAVGYSIDLPRTMDDEMQGLGYEAVSLPSFGKTPAQVAVELATGRVAADGPLPGATDIQPAIMAAHEPYTPEEMARYAAVAAESGEILRETAQWVTPGMTERQVIAHLWEAYVAHGFEGCYMFCAADDRIRRYRHCVPGDNRIERAVLLAPCGAKYGLHVPNSRLVYFEEPPEDIQRRYRAVATMQATMLASLRPGARLTALRDMVMEMFVTLGYPEERWVHFHGGPIGYAGSHWERCLDPQAMVEPNMAFTWYFTVAGAKSEELILIDESGARLCSVDPSWPMLQVTHGDQVVAVPDIMRRDLAGVQRDRPGLETVRGNH